MIEIFNKRLLIITGKGGVGKTTIAAVMAVAAKKLGKKVLVCEINAKEKIAPLLGYEESGSEIKETEKGIFTVNIIPEKAMQEYGIMVLKSKFIYNTIFNNKYVKKFLSAIPGLSEILIWGKIRFHEREKLKDGKNKYDLIIVDAPATGHGITLLKLPMAILSIINKGALAKEGKELYKLLTDTEKTAINIVTIPEELPVNEAEELYKTIKEELKMPLGYLFINSNFSKLFDNRELEIFKSLKNLKNEHFNILKKAVNYRLSRESLNDKYRKAAINKINMREVIFPYLFVKKFTIKDFEYLADILLKS